MGRLSDLVASVTPPPKRGFFYALPADEQAELMHIRRTFQGGGYPSHINATALGKSLAPAIGNSADTIARWLLEKESTDGEASATSGRDTKPEGKQRGKGKAKAPGKVGGDASRTKRTTR